MGLVLRRLNASNQPSLGITCGSKRVDVFIFCLLVIQLLAGCSVSMNAMDSGSRQSEQDIVENLHKDNGQKVGGNCEYRKYQGKAVIVSIIPKPSSGYTAGPSYEEFEVKFHFVAEEEIKEAHGQIEGKEYVLTLTNSWYPGPKFLKKYGIKVGKSFDCILNVITKGACTPIVFDFPDIDQSDYFEIER